MTSAPVATHPRWRRFAARAILLSGAALVGTYLASKAPREQTLVFQPGAARIHSLSATWTRSGEDQPEGGVTLTFPDGTTRDIRHRVTLPSGEYVVEVQLTLEPESPRQRSDGGLGGAPTPRAQTTVVERVRLGGGETLIALGPKGSD